MQFFLTLTVDPLAGPPAELEAAMTEYVENRLKAGRFVITGGLASHADGVRIEVPSTSMPQSEARLSVHGFAIIEVSSLRMRLTKHPACCGYTRSTYPLGPATARSGPS